LIKGYENIVVPSWIYSFYYYPIASNEPYYDGACEIIKPKKTLF